jgi:hypothetical protein
MTYGAFWMAVTPGLSFSRAVILTQSGTAFTYTVPGGSAIRCWSNSSPRPRRDGVAFAGRRDIAVCGPHRSTLSRPERARRSDDVSAFP